MGQSEKEDGRVEALPTRLRSLARVRHEGSGSGGTMVGCVLNSWEIPESFHKESREAERRMKEE